ncbi:hypothetical protein P0Y67_22995, partial [Photobacterium sp. SP02]|uniref:hypothetical protein n=1 Tax=Photobacterium sp. SP02 TaxID=3032280 RepID=UPI00314522F3
MASSKVVKRETEVVTVQSFLAAAHKENNKVSAYDLGVGIASVGIGTMAMLFSKHIASKMGKVLEIASYGLTITGFVTMFLKDPN